MISYIFASCEEKLNNENLDKVFDNFTDINNIVLENKRELAILLNLLSLQLPEPSILSGDFEYQFDLSTQRMKEFNQESFDEFYDHWIKLTNRESSMDEYGQLAFINGNANTWNKRLCRYILQERI
nr:hypothetical protein [uncultured Undibacterium sp.]